MSVSRATAKRTSRGRQRIDIVRMTNESNLQVTFSKHRSGLFKKASELCTLTGSEIAMVVFSPGEKAYSFGSPSVNEIVERFESHQPQILNPSSMVVDAHRRANLQNLNRELGSVEANFERERKRSAELTQMAMDSSRRYWWASQFDNLSMDVLNQYRLALEELHKDVNLEVAKVAPENPQQHHTVQGRNAYDVAAASAAVSAPSAGILMPSATSAFSPYDPIPAPAIPPTIPFSSYVGPSMVNNSISLRNGPSFGLRGNGSGPSAPFDPSASGSGGGGGDAVNVYPYHFDFFHQGFDNGGRPF